MYVVRQYVGIILCMCVYMYVCVYVCRQVGRYVCMLILVVLFCTYIKSYLSDLTCMCSRTLNNGQINDRISHFHPLQRDFALQRILHLEDQSLSSTLSCESERSFIGQFQPFHMGRLSSSWSEGPILHTLFFIIHYSSPLVLGYYCVLDPLLKELCSPLKHLRHELYGGCALFQIMEMMMMRFIQRMLQ